MGGASGRGCWRSGCGRGSGCCVWEAKSHESRIGVSQGFCETFFGSNEFIDGVVFLDSGVGKVVERYDHLGFLVAGGGLVCERAIAGGHAVDAAQFGEGCSPVRLPVVPGLVDDGTTLPFLPCKFHSATGSGESWR